MNDIYQLKTVILYLYLRLFSFLFLEQSPSVVVVGQIHWYIREQKFVSSCVRSINQPTGQPNQRFIRIVLPNVEQNERM